jgi:hypothetical protein
MWPEINTPYKKVNKTDENKNQPDTRKFWMITGDRNSPKVRHYNKQSAMNEAERLAISNPGTEYFVLEAIEIVVYPAGVVRASL